MATDEEIDGRIFCVCAPCELGMDVPDNAFGRIMADQFEQEHKSHQPKETAS